MIRLEVPNKKIHDTRQKINKIKKNKKNCEKVRPQEEITLDISPVLFLVQKWYLAPFFSTPRQITCTYWNDIWHHFKCSKKALSSATSTSQNSITRKERKRHSLGVSHAKTRDLPDQNLYCFSNKYHNKNNLYFEILPSGSLFFFL